MSHEEYIQNYIQNDGLCPLPRRGPRVTVGYWAIDDVPCGTKPEVKGQPMFTITYPVGDGAEAYNWKHIDPFDAAHPVHPNSATEISWGNGHMSYNQWVEFDGRPKLTKADRSPNRKSSFWVLFRDEPDYLFGRIIATYELDAFCLREETKFRLSAADGHHLGTSNGGQVFCADREIGVQNFFRARFPEFEWHEEGGRGDAGAFHLMAVNGRFVRIREDEAGELVLFADASTMDDADLFTAEITRNGLMTLEAEWHEKQVFMTHEPPHGKLRMTEAPDEIWSWFNAFYA